jgi:hypothetical protein
MKYGLFRRKFGAYIVASVIVVALAVAAFFFVDRFFRITDITVVGSDVRVVVDEEKITKNLLFFPADKFRREILVDNPLLSDVRFEKQYPHTLQIIPVLRTPIARLLSDNRLVLIDREAVILEDGDRGLSLPLILLSLPPFRVGERLGDSRITFLLDFITYTSGFLTVNTAREVDGAYVQVKAGKTDILITHNKPIADTIATLQTLISGFRIKGTLPAVVDLRFDKPIVK